MSKFSGLFSRIGNAKKPADYTPRLMPGQHKLALERFQPKEITKKNGVKAIVLEADFTIVESSCHQPGETKGWTWFPGDEFGYQEGRARAFIDCVGECIGDKTPTDQLGEQLSDPSQPGRGIVMLCTVVPVLNKDGSHRTNDKGEMVTNSNFMAINQTLDEVAVTRKELDGMKPLKMASEVAPPPAQPPPAAGRLLGGLGKR